MLDQTILSFKSVSTGATSTTAAGEELSTSNAAVAGVTGTGSADNNSEQVPTDQQFAEVLKQTQSTMDSVDPSEGINSKRLKSDGVSFTEGLSVILPEPFNLTAVPVNTTIVNQELTLKPLKSILTKAEEVVDTVINPIIVDSELLVEEISLDAVDPKVLVESSIGKTVELTAPETLELQVTDKLPILEGNELIIEDSEAPLLATATPVNLADGIEITAIKPVDNAILENRAAPLLPLQNQLAKPVQIPLVTTVVEEPITVSIPKISPVLNDLSVKPNTEQNPLVNVLNQGLVQSQIEKVTMEPLSDSDGIDIDADILKSLGLSPQLSSSTSQTALTAVDNKNSQLTVTIPFQQAQWGSAVAEKVMWLSSHGLQEAEIQLDPPELGPLQVKISVENDKAHVSFVVQHASVKDALDQTVTRLREMFDAEGIDLVNVDVSDQSQQEQSDEASAETIAENTEEAEAQPQETDANLNASLIQTGNGIDAYA